MHSVKMCGEDITIDAIRHGYAENIPAWKPILTQHNCGRNTGGQRGFLRWGARLFGYFARA